MPPRDSLWGTVLIALILCIVCSSVVSIAAVVLKAPQVANEQLDRKKNILIAAQLVEASASADEVESIYSESIKERLVKLDTGKVVAGDGADSDAANDSTPEVSSPEASDADKDASHVAGDEAALDEEATEPIEPAGSLPGFEERNAYEKVYEIVEDGETVGYVMPIYGKGLWSTLYGFIALEADKETVRGITYYKDGETPGLGGEVNNPKWKAQWKDKKVYGDDGDVKLTVVKGKASDEYGIDGLSGATITSKGVDTMIKYWLGPDAFGKYLAKN